MIVESTIGKFSITAKESDDNALTIVAEKHATIVSVLDGIELMGGEENDNPQFSGEDIESFTLFGKPHFRASITRPQLMRFFEYEVLNFLSYTSLTQMRKM